MNETPLIWTKNGNVPIDSLRYEHEWVDGVDVLMFQERWYDESGDLVKNNTHGYVKKGVAVGAQQAQM